MSNSAVGEVYTNIIEEVINQARPDFEDHDTDVETLMELKALWQENLAASGVASFPWAPLPNGADSKNAGAGSSATGPQHAEGTSGADGEGNGASAFPRDSGSTAAMRAAQQIQALAQRQGESADSWNETINNLQAFASQMQNQGAAGGSSGLQLPSGEPDAAVKPEPGTAEPELADDATTEQIDEHIARRAQAAQARKRSPSDSDLSEREEKRLARQSSSQADADDDAINSDLDDPESDEDEEEADYGADAAGQNIILCQYDRVARVKNKWKCVLKDGVVAINGKDYLFIKGNGEFEW